MFNKFRNNLLSIFNYSEVHKAFLLSAKCPNCGNNFKSGFAGLNFYSKTGKKLSFVSYAYGIPPVEFAECPQCHYRWEIYNRSQSTVPEKLPQQEVRVYLEPELEKVRANSETIIVPVGVKIKVRRSRTIEHTIDIVWRDLQGGNLSLGFKDVVNISVRTEIENQKGRSYTESETIEYEVELDGQVSSQYSLIWSDVWCKGVIEVPNNNVTQLVPFRFREHSELEVTPQK